MDVRKEILREHSRANINRVVKYIGDDPLRFKDLVHHFLAGPYRVTQRAASPLSYAVERYPNLIKPHLRKIIAQAAKSGAQDAVKRNTMRLLQFIEIPEKDYGKVAALAFRFLGDASEAVAIRVFSMTVLANLMRHVPDLKNELTLHIEGQLPYASAAFASRAKKILLQIKDK
jgi:hypothetical protein